MNDDEIRYTPVPLCCDSIKPAPRVRDTFSYTVNDYDDMLKSNKATVAVDIIYRRGAVTTVSANHCAPLDSDTVEEGEEITLTEACEPNRGTRERIGDDVKYTPEPCNEGDKMKGSYDGCHDI